MCSWSYSLTFITVSKRFATRQIWQYLRIMTRVWRLQSSERLSAAGMRQTGAGCADWRCTSGGLSGFGSHSLDRRAVRRCPGTWPLSCSRTTQCGGAVQTCALQSAELFISHNSVYVVRIVSHVIMMMLPEIFRMKDKPFNWTATKHLLWTQLHQILSVTSSVLCSASNSGRLNSFASKSDRFCL